MYTNIKSPTIINANAITKPKLILNRPILAYNHLTTKLFGNSLPIK